MTDQIKDRIAAKLAERADMIARYGTGVRPSFVSTDIAILDHEIEMLRQQIREME